MVKYVPTCTKGTLYRSAKDISNDAHVMFLYFFFPSEFLNYESICCGWYSFELPQHVYESICCMYSFELHQQVDAIQMGTYNLCLNKEVEKKYTGCNLKTMDLLDCVLIGYMQ